MTLTRRSAPIAHPVRRYRCSIELGSPDTANDPTTPKHCRDRSRHALDEAVRTRGVDPGGRLVPDRAVEAGAWLVSECGLATVTLEAVAEAAGRSVHSRYSIFGTRDELLAAIYEWYSPLDDLVRLSRDSSRLSRPYTGQWPSVLRVGRGWRRRCWHICSAIRTAQRRGSSHPPLSVPSRSLRGTAIRPPLACQITH